MYLALKVSLVTINQLDAILCDQVSVCIPILRFLRPFIGIVFYCHYPDLLLSSKSSFLKRVYRYPFDRLEEITTGLADIILVNSKFTQATFERTFTMLSGTKPMVVYPCIKITEDEQEQEQQELNNKNKTTTTKSLSVIPPPPLPNDNPVILLSINRYERKKGINIAIEAMGLIHEKYANVHLIIAGGYDTRVAENVEHYNELVTIAKQCNLLDTKDKHQPMFETSRDAIRRILPDWINDDKKQAPYDPIQIGKKITFIRSFTDEQKQCLLRNCTAVLYTPQNEHFGIVPLECMVNYRPVIACNSGGPLESVNEYPEKDRTGYLCPPNPSAFAQAMENIVANREKALALGKNGYKHVRSQFSRTTFGATLNKILRTVGTPTSLSVVRNQQGWKNLYLWFSLLLMIIIVGVCFLAVPYGYRIIKELFIVKKFI